MTKLSKKFSRRTIALFWCLAVAVVIGALIFLEQIALLYVLATLSLALLLIIVGFSDLENVGKGSGGTAAAKD